ncbi:MAG: hypothetical protein O7E52_04265 [Candidatus Poribacteria bacterium]|nr:hypothetical protein [Candidatus Poribacteria bacterium]
MRITPHTVMMRVLLTAFCLSPCHSPVAIKEMARILKPGGTLVITDIDEHTFTFLRDEHHDRWLGFKRADIRRWFTDAGFKHVVVDDAGERCCGQSSCGSEYTSISIFVASGEK